MNANDVKQLLVSAGFPDNSLMFALGQACFESGSITFDSENDLLDNNLTGIIWANASWQKNATQGGQMPLSDTGGEVSYYAKFDTLQDWANDFHRIVHAQYCKANGFYADWNTEGRPIDATDLPTYVHRLKLNHYFGGDEAVYLAGIERFLNELNA